MKQKQQNIMSNHLDSFSEGVSKYLAMSVLPIITNYLTNKGLTVTVDDLMKALNAPRSTVNAFEPETPSYLGGTSSTASSTTAVKPAGTRRTNKGDYAGPTCKYIFTKGVRKGDYCGAPCAPDNPERCKSCARKKNGGGSSTTASTSDSVGSSAPSTEDNNVLDAVAIDERKGLYRETSYNILIHQADDKTYAKGVIIDNSTLQTRPLNDAEKEYCRKKLMTINDQANPAPTTTVQPTTASSLGNLDEVLKTLTR